MQEVLWRSSSDKDGTMSVYEFFAWLFFDLFALLPVAANGALHPRRAWQWTGCRCHGSRANDEDRGPILVNAHASVLVDSLAPRRGKCARPHCVPDSA